MQNAIFKYRLLLEISLEKILATFKAWVWEKGFSSWKASMESFAKKSLANVGNKET